MRGEVGALIKEMQEACRRPLFLGIQLSGDTKVQSIQDVSNSATPTEATSSGYPESESGSANSVPRVSYSKRTRTEVWTLRPWDEILADVAELLPFMTQFEHGQVTRLAGILLLGFLLPQSTGNEFFLLQNLSSKRTKKASNQEQPNKFGAEKQLSGIQMAEYIREKEDMGDYIVQMSLEERLEACPHRYNPDEFGEFDSVVFEPLEAAFQSFLERGLTPFLSGRPAHTQEVDLFHILAMAIHPQPSEQSIHQTASKLEEECSESWEKTKRLMSSLTPHSFHVNYRHRLQLVRIVTDCLMVPEFGNVRAVFDAPLFEGALPHLRASLSAFGMASINPIDAHMAHCGMVSLAIQSAIDYVVREEWSRLSNRIVDDRTNYPGCPQCGCGISQSNDKHEPPNVTKKSPIFTGAFSLMSNFKDDTFCPHRARGELLLEFLTRYSQARHFAKEDFLQYALESLTDAIEMQVDFWSKDEEGEDDSDDKVNVEDATMKDEKEDTTSQPPCVLASLLSVAKYLFVFVLPVKSEKADGKKEDNEGEEEIYRRDILVSCGIQLVHHWHPIIVKEACTMLVFAFSYTEEMWEDYVGAVFESVKIGFEISLKSRLGPEPDSVVPIEGLIGAFSQRSMTFAANVMKELLSRKSEREGNSLVLFRLVAAVATARPSISESYRDVLQECLKTSRNPDVAKHIVASLLACRKATYFAKEPDSESKLLSLASESVRGDWRKYQIARQALLTGNCAVSKVLFNNLAISVSSETSYVWLSGLEKVAEAEAALSFEAARALPMSTANLRIAINAFRSLPSLYQLGGNATVSTDFQIRFLELRVDFLDLLTAVRQLIREMRLLGVGPKKHTRPHIHLKKLIQQFFGVGQMYNKLYIQHGLFICQQSRCVLRTLHALCVFIGRSTRLVFDESFAVTPIDKAKKMEDGFESADMSHGDSSQPLTLLMKQLETVALKEMDQSVEPKIRAAVMLEIIEGILRAPVPIPRALMVTKSIPRAHLHLTWDPMEHCEANTQKMRTEGSFAILACGKISLLSKADIPFNLVLLWYTLTPKGKTRHQESKQGVDEGRTKSDWLHRLLHIPPIATSLSPSGTFFTKITSQMFLNEGTYDVEFRLGCRDIRGGEWELPLVADPQQFSVEVRRSS